jgi:hypothetical protein
MAKNSIRDYSATNSSNTDIQSIDISEGCSPAGINNAIREVMADLKDVSTGAVALESPSADSLTVTGTVTAASFEANAGGTFTTASGNDLNIVYPANRSLFIKEDTQTNLTIDNVGNVGIGTSSPNEKVTSSNGFLSIGAVSTTVRDGAIVDYSGTIGRFIAGRAGGNYGQWEAHVAGASGVTKRYQIDYDSTNRWYAANGTTERMRIDSSGRLLLNQTTNNGTSLMQMITPTSTSAILVQIGTNGYHAMSFLNSGGAAAVGSITVNSASTSYNTSSDYRLKTAVEYDWDATTRLKQLKPARFEWISEGDDAVPVDGFLAHEVQDIVPESITGTKDAMRDEEYEVTPAVLDEDGNVVTPAVMGTRSVPDYQGIDQSKLVPLLVKTIQELEARITALEAN